MLGYHGHKHNELFVPGLAIFIIGFAFHGYNTIRAMTMMYKKPNNKDSPRGLFKSQMAEGGGRKANWLGLA